jgi:hypothetical protein
MFGPCPVDNSEMNSKGHYTPTLGSWTCVTGPPIQVVKGGEAFR